MTTASSWAAQLPLLPIALATLGALVLLVLEVLLRPRSGEQATAAPSSVLTAFGVGTVVAVAASTLWAWYALVPGVATFFSGRFVVDAHALFFDLVFALAAGITLFISGPYLEREGASARGEYGSLVLFALVGMMAMASARDLMTVFLGLETMSIAVYVLVGFRRGNLRSNESALKYFFLGAFASGAFLYGIALCYGMARTTLLPGIAAAIVTQPSPLLAIGALLVLLGFAFKIGAVPFHMWLPDVYEGAPAPVTGFMATGVKAAAFAALLRLMVSGFVASPGWHEVIWILAVLTMFGGNALALVQTNLKRMLAYSGIASSGYLLVGVAALAAPGARADAAAAVLIYLVAYTFTTLGAFACVGYLSRRGERLQRISDYAGLVRRHPWIVAGLGVCLASYVGFPPTAGFFGKYALFAAAIRAGDPVLVVIGVVNSALSVYYYLRILVLMVFGEPLAGDEDPDAETLPADRRATGLTVGYASVALLWGGLGPVPLLWVIPGIGTLISWAHTSVASLL